MGDGFVVNLESIKTWKRPRWLSINNLSSSSAAVESVGPLQQKGQSSVGDGCSIFNCPKQTISIQTSDDGPTEVQSYVADVSYTSGWVEKEANR